MAIPEGMDMKVSPTPSWELTNEHATSAYAVPVLVNRHDGRAYGPGEILSPHPSWIAMTAASAVTRMKHGRVLTAKEEEFLARFTK
jgi:hypothetical protein